MEKWQKGLVLDEGARVALARAEEAARLTRELLTMQGWCLWRCAFLNGEVIAMARDDSVKGIPDGYLVYTEAELEELCQGDVSEATLRLVHEAKKIAGAVVISVEGAERLKEGG